MLNGRASEIFDRKNLKSTRQSDIVKYWFNRFYIDTDDVDIKRKKYE